MIPFRGANSRVLKQPRIEDVDAVLDGVQSAGGNAWAINTIWYCNLAPGSSTITRPPAGHYPGWLVEPDVLQAPTYVGESTDVERIYIYAKKARDRGMRVILKPMVDCRWPGGPGGWRGWAVLPTALRYSFMQDYKKRFLEPLIPVVRELGTDLCFGTELFEVTRQYRGSVQLELATWLRRKSRLGYNTPISYAANWGNTDDPQAEWRMIQAAGVWAYCDYIGIDAYWPFASPAASAEAWPAIVKGVHAQAAGKPIWFTEVGWPNTPDAASNPFGDGYDPGNPPPYTTEVSGEMWRIARAAWDGILEGWLAWEAGLVAGTHNILGTPCGGIAWRP